jgi:hypothetical protein
VTREQSRPVVSGPAEEKASGDDGLSAASLPQPADSREHLRQLLHQIVLDEAMRRRSVQQAILTASAWWWRWRAEQFHRARPRPSDFNGQSSVEELGAADERCSETAQACLNRATLIEWEAAEDE